MIEGNFKTFTAGETLAANRLVKLDSSANVVYTTLNSVAIGVTQDAATSGDPVNVALLSTGRTFEIATEAGATVGNCSGIPSYNGMLHFGIISGISPTFVALESLSGASGGIIEVLRFNTTNGISY
jgi:hypothetical protein